MSTENHRRWADHPLRALARRVANGDSFHPEELAHLGQMPPKLQKATRQALAQIQHEASTPGLGSRSQARLLAERLSLELVSAYDSAGVLTAEQVEAVKPVDADRAREIADRIASRRSLS